MLGQGHSKASGPVALLTKPSTMATMAASSGVAEEGMNSGRRSMSNSSSPSGLGMDRVEQTVDQADRFRMLRLIAGLPRPLAIRNRPPGFAPVTTVELAGK